MIKKCFNLLLISIFAISLSGCIKVKEIANTDIKNNIEKSDDGEYSIMKIIINNEEYIINLENNETVRELVGLLPLELDMNELNGNEKYAYLDNVLPTNPSSVKHINSGDVMLYGDNCIVIFYKSFDTSYSYTKIGHIENLHNLKSGSIKVKIFK